MSAPHVVIVGGGFGGLTAAQQLRRAPVRVTLLDRRNHHVFQPLLYQVATATLSPGNIASPIRWILRKGHNMRILMGEAERVDVDARRVILTDGAACEYDYLILAPGASHSYFNHPEWAAYAPGLKTLEDALDMRRRILLAFERAEREPEAGRRHELLTFVIVGAGPTGVELAGTLAEIARRTLRGEYRFIDTAQTRILLVEAGPTILPSFPDRLRDAARASLRALGVEVIEGVAVTGIDAHGAMIAGERVWAGTVLWAAGVTASPLLRTLGAPLDRAGRVLVHPDLSIPGHPEVFVIGDGAFVTNADGTPVPGVAQPAMQGGAHAASTIQRELRGRPRQPFVYRNYGNMAIVGRGAAIADLNWVRFSGHLAWWAWLLLHIMMLIGFRNRAAVLLDWATAYFTFQRSARLITERQ